MFVTLGALKNYANFTGKNACAGVTFYDQL